MSWKLNTTPGLIDGRKCAQARAEWIGAGGKEHISLVRVIQALLLDDWLFSNWCMLIGEKRGPKWWEWHDGSWVADHILWLSWRCAWLVWLLTQIECSQRRWTLSQTQGHWWLTYAWWLERLHQNHWYILLRRVLGMQSSVWIYSFAIFFFFAFYKKCWDILATFRLEFWSAVHRFPISCILSKT